MDRNSLLWNGFNPEMPYGLPTAFLHALNTMALTLVFFFECTSFAKMPLQTPVFSRKLQILQNRFWMKSKS